MTDDAHETASPLGRTPIDDSMEFALSASAVEHALFGQTTSVQIGRFVLLGELGRGGMGVVYSAWDPQLDRRVALKVVRPELAGERRDARMIREAKAAARLSDPHIVAVHEVGEAQGRMFIAMEYVTGESLGSYTASTHGWKVTVQLYLQAARGLAAAHAAGIVHRDFKPSNVLVSGPQQKLRAQVTDFGVARVASSPDEPAETVAEAPVDLTVDGAMLGTPAYMAPEQFDGASVGPAADQFSLCVALFEALYGSRPFRGDTVAALSVSVHAGTITHTSRGRVPAAIDHAVRRGLRVDPAARHPDMGALIDALESATHRRRRFATVGAIGLAIGSAAIAGALGRGDAGPRCQGLDEAWTVAAGHGDDLVQGLVELSPGDDTLAKTTASSIDHYGRQWVGARTSVCEATQVLGTQSPALLDVRVACLDQLRLEASGLFEALADESAATRRTALDAVSRLDPPSFCTSATAANTAVPPEDPALRESYDALLDGLAAVRTDFRLSRWKAGHAHTSALLEQARDYGDDKLIARVLAVHAMFEARVGDPKRAAAWIREALMLAVREGDDASAANHALGLVYVYGYVLGDTDTAEMFGALALAWIGPSPEQSSARAAALDNLGINAFKAGDYVLAEERHRAARSLLESGPEDIRASINLAAALAVSDELDKHQEARALLEQTLADAESAYGPSHPTLAAILQNLAGQAPLTIPCGDALPMLERALEIKVEALGPHALPLISTLMTLSTCHREAGAPADALQVADRAIAIVEAKLGPQAPRVLGPHERRIEALLAMGRLDDAQHQLDATTGLAEALFGLDDPEGYGLFTHRAALLRARGLHEEALVPATTAVELARALSPSSPWTHKQELSLAALLVHLGRAEEAEPYLRSVIASKHPGPLARRLRVEATALLAQE